VAQKTIMLMITSICQTYYFYQIAVLKGDCKVTGEGYHVKQPP